MPSMIDVGRKTNKYLCQRRRFLGKRKEDARNRSTLYGKEGGREGRALLPWLGKMSLDDISPSDIKRALIELGTNGGRSGDGLSPSTLRAVHLAGSMTFEWAIANDLATINPFKQAPRPKASRTQTKVLDSDQAAHLTAAMTSTMREKLEEGKGQQASFALAVCIAIATGMRRGEIFALEWGDVDTARQRISVSKAIKADGKLGNPKSESSVRSVAIGSNLLKLLDEMRRWQSKNVPQKAWTKRNSVLCNDKGGHANMSTFEHWWRAWADASEWSGLRFHDLRHSHAAILLSSYSHPQQAPRGTEVVATIICPVVVLKAQAKA